METKNIMIVGVGGQGTLLASKLLGHLLLNQGYDVKVSEVHGMSQRGGSVVTYVRYGTKVASPVIDVGEVRNPTQQMGFLSTAGRCRQSSVTPRASPTPRICPAAVADQIGEIDPGLAHELGQ